MNDAIEKTKSEYVQEIIYSSDIKSPSTTSEEDGVYGFQLKRGRKTDKERIESGQRREWTDDEVIQLIDLWRENSVLYDNEHPMYYVASSRKDAIDRMSKSLEISVKDINDKMHSLRTYYGSQRQRKEAMCKRNPNFSPLSYPKWKFYDQMSFLYESVTLRAAKCEANGGRGKKRKESMLIQKADTTQILTPNEHEFHQQNIYESHSPCDPQHENNYITTEEITDYRQNNSLNNKKQRFIEYNDDIYITVPDKMKNPNELSNNSDDLFGNMITCTLKEMKDVQKKEFLKIEIQRLIYNTRFPSN